MNQTLTTLDKLIVYPNPSSTQISFNLNIKNIENVKIFDMNGRLINLSSIKIQNNLVTVDIQHLEVGMYFINATDENGLLRRTKFTKIN